jgi:AcrR family transcriptional regulator
MTAFTLKEKKYAALKIAILEDMLRLLEKNSLAEITVEEICRNINTSKVTFFKYFKYKEQVLDYFVYRWQYQRSYELQTSGISGEEGLRSIFRSIKGDAFGKSVMISLVHYYSKLKERPEPIFISDCEYFLFCKQAYDLKVKPRDTGEIFLEYLKKIPGIGKEKYSVVIRQLVALFYGVPLQAHVMGDKKLSSLYDLGVTAILEYWKK